MSTAARVMSVGGPGEVLVSSSLHDVVAGSSLGFEDHGVHQLKGIGGEWRLFGVTDVDGQPRPSPWMRPRPQGDGSTSCRRRRLRDAAER